jgi:hypothetical protein
VPRAIVERQKGKSSMESRFVREKKELNKYWKVFNNKSFYGKWLKHFKLKNIEKVKKSIKDYLWEAYWSLIRAKKLENVKEQTRGLEKAISLIIQHREEFQKIGYDYESFDEMQQNTNYTKDAFLADRYVSFEDEDYLMGYSKMIFKMSRDLESFLKIDADLERKKVSERKERIEQLLEALPEVRPTVSDLPREQWWKVYIDAPMHKKAQMLSDPGHCFDQDRSPGYQKSMICLFEKILVPAQNRIQECMNYEKYTEIHEIATEYIPDDYSKKYMRASGGIAIVKLLGYEEVLGSHYGLANVGDEEMYERLAALQELQGENINGSPLLQNWKSGEHDFQWRVKELAKSGSNAITVSWVDQTCKVDRSSHTIGNGAIEIIMAYRKAECPRYVNAILEQYYQGRERLDQNERQRLTEIARTVRALHVMHPKGDGNGRTHIFGLMNKWLIEEGFPPAILPNGPGVFGGLKTLDGLVEDMLEGMHAFVKVVEESKKEG